MTRALTCAALLAMPLLGYPTLAAQQASTSPPRPAATQTVEEAFTRQWNGVMRKIGAAIRQFPAEKIDYKTHADVRSFLEEAWHLSATVEWLNGAMQGKPTPDRLFSGDGRTRDPAEVADRFEAAAKGCADQIASKVDPRSVSVLTHAAEIYGKMVAMYRVNGLVPPETAARAQR